MSKYFNKYFRLFKNGKSGKHFLGFLTILLLVVFVGLFFLLSSVSEKNSFAQQTGDPVDVTGDATYQEVPQGFQVTFSKPVVLKSVSYNGPYRGTCNVYEGPRDEKDGIEKALSYIDHALELSPDEPTLLDTKGLILIKDGRPQDAIPFLEKAVELTCEGPVFVLHLAYAQLKTGQVDHAENTLNKVRSILTSKIDQLSDENKQMINELEMKLGGPGN